MSKRYSIFFWATLVVALIPIPIVTDCTLAAWPVLAAGIGATVAGASGYLNYKSAKQTNETNMQAVRETNQSNEMIARKNNEAQAALQRENNQFNAEQAELAFQRESNWNSPVNQMKLKQQAGINPFVAASEGLQQASASGQQATAASAGAQFQSPTLQAPQAQNPGSPVQGLTAGFSEIASALASIADAKKKGVETTYLEESMNDSLAKLKSEVTNQDLQNKLLKDQQEWYHEFGRTEYTQRIREAEERINKLAREASLVKSQEELVEYEKSLKLSQTWLNEEMKKCKGEEYRSLKFVADHQMELFTQQLNELREQIKLLKAKQATEGTIQQANIATAHNQTAQAQLHRENAETIRIMRPLQKEAQELANAIQRNEKEFSNVTFNERYNTFMEQAEQAGIVTDQLKVALEVARTAHDWQQVAIIIGLLGQTAKAAADGMSAYGSARAGRPAPMQTTGYGSSATYSY